MPNPNEILTELKKVKYPGFTRDVLIRATRRIWRIQDVYTDAMTSAYRSSNNALNPSR